jgi:hypothetical protein
MAQFNSDFRSPNPNGAPKPLISTQFNNLVKTNKELFNTKAEYSNGLALKLKNNQNNYTSDIEKELTDLTLSIGKWQVFYYVVFLGP